MQQQSRRTAQNDAASGRQRTKSVKKKKKQKVRYRNKNLKYQLLTLVAVVLAVVLCLVVFFRVNHINVLNSGNPEQSDLPESEQSAHRGYYTAQEIEAASGISLGDNLLTISKEAVAARIMAELPYISEVTVRRVLPGTVDITVSEFDVTYSIQDTAGGWWLINRNGTVLEQTDEAQASTHLTVKGLLAETPEPAKELVPESTEDMTEQEAKKTSLISILQLLEGYGYCKDLVTLDLTSSYDICLWYGTQFEIRIGNTEDLSYKLAYLEGVLRELQSYQSGVIDLTFAEDKTARFQPFSE